MSAVDEKTVKVDDIMGYDTIIHGVGLYSEVINGVTLITKNIRLKGEKLIVYTTGITPIDYRNYYDTYVLEKNFPNTVHVETVAKFCRL